LNRSGSGSDSRRRGSPIKSFIACDDSIKDPFNKAEGAASSEQLKNDEADYDDCCDAVDDVDEENLR